jgi:uncharacterized protein
VQKELLQALIQSILGQYRLSPWGTHGVEHWGRVLENGKRLAPLTGADPRVLEMFAVFHDACRESEGRDHGHGARGAALAERLRANIDLDGAQFDLLIEACECHTRGPRPKASVTVLSCLDADRLDIPRVGMWVKPQLLCTTAAREPALMKWASGRAARRERPAVCAEEWGMEPG